MQKSRIPVPFILLRYLLQELLPPCLLVFAVLTSLVFFQQFARNVDFILAPNVTWQISLQMMLSLLPGILIFSIPLSLLIGFIVTLGRLSADQEWIILVTSRIHPFFLALPLFGLALVGAVVMFYLSSEVMPGNIGQLRELRNKITLQQSANVIKPGQFITNFPNHLLRVQSVDLAKGIWKGVFIVKHDPVKNTLQVHLAEQGILSGSTVTDPLGLVQADGNFEIKLFNGITIDKLLSPTENARASFSDYTIKITNPNLARKANPVDPVKVDSLANLPNLKTAALAKVWQSPTVTPALANGALAELVWRICWAAACLLAALASWRINAIARGRNHKPIAKLSVGLLCFICVYICLNTAYQRSLTGKAPLGLAFALALLVSVLVTLFLPLLLRLQVRMKWPFARTVADSPRTADKAETSGLAQTLSSFFHLRLSFALLFSECVKYFFTSAAVLLLTILLFTLLDVSNSAARNGIKSSFVLGYLGLLAPQMIYYFAPFSLFLAISITALVLSRSGQFKMLIYHSRSLFELLLPFLTTCLVLLGGMYLLAEKILPLTNQEQDRRFKLIKGRNTDDISVATAFNQRWFSDLNADQVYAVQVLKPPAQTTEMQANLLAFTFQPGGHYLKQIAYLQAVTIARGKTVTANQGFSYQADQAGQVTLRETAPSSAVDGEIFFRSIPSETSKMNFNQLVNYIRQTERTGWPVRPLKMEKAQRLVFPVSCLSLLLLAFPLGLLQIKRNHQGSIKMLVISIFAALLFWGCLNLFETFGKMGIVPIDLAVWAPHALFITFAFFLYTKTTAQ